jgi:5-methylcytosine-specific restriction endonuclease McrA
MSIFERDNFTCLHCGTNENLTIDHIVPWVKGGGNEMGNLQTLCQSCNSRKGVK